MTHTQTVKHINSGTVKKGVSINLLNFPMILVILRGYSGNYFHFFKNWDLTKYIVFLKPDLFSVDTVVYIVRITIFSLCDCIAEHSHIVVILSLLLS